LKNQKFEAKSAHKNQMSYVLVFKPHLRSKWHLPHFSICKKIFHSKARFNTNKFASHQIFSM